MSLLFLWQQQLYGTLMLEYNTIPCTGDVYVNDFCTKMILLVS